MVNTPKTLEETKECINEVCQKADDFVSIYRRQWGLNYEINGMQYKIVSLLSHQIQERRAGEQRRANRERKVNKLQEQLDASHDNLRDGIENMEQNLAERYEVKHQYSILLQLVEFSKEYKYQQFH